MMRGCIRCGLVGDSKVSIAIVDFKLECTEVVLIVFDPKYKSLTANER
jgi:hypothetical protein